MVLPGLIDSHVHMLDAGLARQRCVLDEAKTPAEVLAIIADYNRDHPDLSWVIGGGWASILLMTRPYGVGPGYGWCPTAGPVHHQDGHGVGRLTGARRGRHHDVRAGPAGPDRVRRGGKAEGPCGSRPSI